MSVIKCAKDFGLSYWTSLSHTIAPYGLRLPLSMKAYLIGFLGFYLAIATVSLGGTDTTTWGGDNFRTGYHPYVLLASEEG
jgi:hypothetical protein